MPIDYMCPFCHAKFFVDDVYRGQSGPCAECGKTITIPGRATSENLEIEAEQRVATLEARVRNAKWIRIGILSFVLVTFVSIVYLAGLVLLPEISRIQERRNTTQSLGNLQRVAQALNNYALEYGTYPPPVVYDAAGTPLYSWRVLILPQLGYRNIYEQFNLAESWSSWQNMMLVDRMPSEYRLSGAASMALSGETAVCLVTGTGTLFPVAGPMSPTAVTDMPKATILVTEATRAINTWTSPSDCTFLPASGIGSKPETI